MTGADVVDAVDLAVTEAFAIQAHHIVADLVRGGAALGWVRPPGRREISVLLRRLAREARDGDASIRAAVRGDALVGFGYWRRYARPTHRPHADLEKIAVEAGTQGQGVGRRLTAELVDAARRAGIEVLTLDCRGDNHRALSLYRGLGFTEYGRLENFVAVGPERYDKVFYALDLRRSR